jgi:acyl-CoA hydrolase
MLLDEKTNKLLGNKLISLESALNLIKPHDRIVASMAAAEPSLFLEHIGTYAEKLQNVELYCANPSRPYQVFTDQNLEGHIHASVMFLTSAIRKHQGHNCVHYVPQHLSQWFQNFSRRGPIHIFWGTCSVPDQRGFVSLGVGACYETEALRSADLVILEVNPYTPTTYGATTIPMSAIDHFIWNPHPLSTVEHPEITPDDRKIGNFVADLVPNQSTLQLGIGAIPDAIGEALSSKKNLGIHTEMINDTMMELALKGVIDGSCKTIWPGKMIGAFAYGSSKLYEFLDGNPMIEFHPASVVNDPYRIGRNHLMTSVNTAIEVDLTGQVVSESVGHQEISGVGGASDTHVGAQRSAGGQGIIALKSTSGNNSKIVFELRPGAKVSISRNDIDTIVTEFGIARLKGKSVAERSRAMISIAHPEFRENLIFKAKQNGYI